MAYLRLVLLCAKNLPQKPTPCVNTHICIILYYIVGEKPCVKLVLCQKYTDDLL